MKEAKAHKLSEFAKNSMSLSLNMVVSHVKNTLYFMYFKNAKLSLKQCIFLLKPKVVSNLMHLMNFAYPSTV